MDYYSKKAKAMYGLYLKGETCRKVYAAVRKGNKFVVIENSEGRNYKYQIAGGGVESGETNEEAIVREIIEELGIISKVVKSLGVTYYDSNWKYEDKEFIIKNEAEIFLVEFVSYVNNDKFGLDGEFDKKNVKGITLVSEEEMCSNVYEFTAGGLKFKK